MKIRAMFHKKNYLKYISQLDLVRLFQRSFNRADMPIRYSEGFNPHPKFSIANPLSIGIESEVEYIDVELIDDVILEDFIISMNKVLPEDVQIIKAEILEELKSNKLSIDWAFYEIKFLSDNTVDDEIIKERLKTWLENTEVYITKIGNKGKNKVEKKVNIIPLIANANIMNKDNDFHVINSLLKAGENGNLRPFDFIEAFKRDSQLPIDLDSLAIKRIGQFITVDGEICSPMN